MRFTGFDGREYPINVSDYLVYGNDTRARSGLHLEARKLLKQLFPADTILEEVTLPGSKKSGSCLYADFLLPLQKVMVEVQGEQHYVFTPYFHRSKEAFTEAKKRDRDKKEWCEINGLILVELPFNKKDEWRNRIVNRWD